MSEFWQNIFYALVAEVFVVLTAWLVKEDKRRQVIVLALGTAIAGTIGFSPLIFQSFSTSFTATPTPGVNTPFAATTSNPENAQPVYFPETPSGSNPQSVSTPFALGKLIFDENFDNNNNEWATGKDNNNEYYLDNGEYHIIGSSWLGIGNLRNFGDFYLEVKTRRLEDSVESSDYGVYFRRSELINYVFVINPDQQSYALQRIDMPTDQYTALIAWVYSPKISSGFEENKIGILCSGSTITIYMNGYRIDSIQDSNSLSGNFGIVGGGGEHVAIDYLKIWALK